MMARITQPPTAAAIDTTVPVEAELADASGGVVLISCVLVVTVMLNEHDALLPEITMAVGEKKNIAGQQ